MIQKHSISIIGAGKLGKTLGRLFVEHDVFDIHDILNSSIKSAKYARDFITQGRVIDNFNDLAPADLFLISVPDDKLSHCCEKIYKSGIIQNGTVIFHASGSKPSSLFSKLKEQGAFIASIHPIKSFALPENAINTFKGTFCSFEGDNEAYHILKPAFERLNSSIFTIKTEHKIIYHAGSVFASNYLISLVKSSLTCLTQSGIDETTALNILKPMMFETLNNIFDNGLEKSLTGPISRGDTAIVMEQMTALQDVDHNISDLYQKLGLVAFDVIKDNKHISDKQKEELKKILSSENKF